MGTPTIPLLLGWTYGASPAVYLLTYLLMGVDSGWAARAHAPPIIEQEATNAISTPNPGGSKTPPPKYFDQVYAYVSMLRNLMPVMRYLSGCEEAPHINAF